MDGNIRVLARQQVAAIDAVSSWLRLESQHKRVFKLFGYAGAGKSAIAKHVATGIDGHVQFAAFTGKAALVMRQNGCDGASTIHNLIYWPRPGSNGGCRFVRNPESPVAAAALVVIDECSMVDETLARDLLSFGTPILVLGDPAQLPPVSGAGFFMRGAPDVMLTEIHRQALDSPIIHLATAAREGRSLPFGEYGSSRVIGRGSLSVSDFSDDGQILVGTNRTRNSLNSVIREASGKPKALPVLGDRLVCNKNDHPLGILNGELFHVIEEPQFDAATGVICMTLKATGSDEKTVDVRVRRECFQGDIDRVVSKDHGRFQDFDFGYALTVHKAQGSQWSNVLVWDESATFGDNRWRWLYTAITRASERVTIVI